MSALKRNNSDQSIPHIDILDGIRGVAAVFVVLYHLIETYQCSSIHIINHAYLAVDLFYILSGFVVSYAYDLRLRSNLSLLSFFKRRLFRLQPMVVFASVLGAALYFFQSSPAFPCIVHTGWKMLLLVTIMHIFFIPCTSRYDIRGWDEMFCLNSPQWTLFFEYIANILYGLVLHKLSVKSLWFITLIFALLTLNLSLGVNVGNLYADRNDLLYTVIGGWCWNSSDIFIGFSRLMFPFCCGILIHRMNWRISIKHSFAAISCIIMGVSFFPKMPGILNGVFEATCILIIFPIIIMIGYGNNSEEKNKRYLLIGKVSYPLYITHFPFVYLQASWVSRHPSAGLMENILVSTFCFTIILLVAFLSYKYYESPVRKKLQFAHKSNSST